MLFDILLLIINFFAIKTKTIITKRLEFQQKNNHNSLCKTLVFILMYYISLTLYWKLNLKLELFKSPNQLFNYIHQINSKQTIKLFDQIELKNYTHIYLMKIQFILNHVFSSIQTMLIYQKWFNQKKFYYDIIKLLHI